MKRYRLPCESCGEFNLVTTTQAGQYIDCYHCGKEVSIPRMGMIRSLEPEFNETEIQGSSGRHSQEWSRSKGLAFSFGLFLMVAGFGLAIWSYTSYRKADLVVQDAQQHINLTSLQERREKAEKMNLSGLFSAWEPYMIEAIVNGNWTPSRYYEHVQKRDLAFNWLVATGIIGLAGSLTLGGSFLFKK